MPTNLSFISALVIRSPPSPVSSSTSIAFQSQSGNGCWKVPGATVDSWMLECRGCNICLVGRCSKETDVGEHPCNYFLPTSHWCNWAGIARWLKRLHHESERPPLPSQLCHKCTRWPHSLHLQYGDRINLCTELLLWLPCNWCKGLWGNYMQKLKWFLSWRRQPLRKWLSFPGHETRKWKMWWFSLSDLASGEKQTCRYFDTENKRGFFKGKLCAKTSPVL